MVCDTPPSPSLPPFVSRLVSDMLTYSGLCMQAPEVVKAGVNLRNPGYGVKVGILTDIDMISALFVLSLWVGVSDYVRVRQCICAFACVYL
jgi:hypothetical protein